MKLIIAGGRDITDENVVGLAWAKANIPVPSEVVSGGARGVDTLGERWAAEHNIPVKRFPADWERYSYRAGPIRNKQMAEYGDVLLAIWDGASKGTYSMISLALSRGIRVYIYRLDTGEIHRTL